MIISQRGASEPKLSVRGLPIVKRRSNDISLASFDVSVMWSGQQKDDIGRVPLEESPTGWVRVTVGGHGYVPK